MSDTVLSGPPESIVPTRYWHRREDGRIQCDLCPRFCKLQEGLRERFQAPTPAVWRVVIHRLADDQLAEADRYPVL